MDREQEWRRLLELIESARQRTEHASECQSSAADQLDVAEYDLRQIADAIREVMGGDFGREGAAAPAAEGQSTPLPAPRRASGG